MIVKNNNLAIISGQSYKASTRVNYDSSSHKDNQFISIYESRVVIYKRKTFVRLATGHTAGSCLSGQKYLHRFSSFDVDADVDDDFVL